MEIEVDTYIELKGSLYMKIILIIMPLFLNIWVVLFPFDSVFPLLLAGILVGLYKGIQTGPDIKRIFNLYKVNYSQKIR